ncbi:MAG: 50S ribosomal protein L17 [Candidatus Magasanikbacteria bacterium RIFOXYC2_FULL_40_16]|uniref:Large ribosomal subunit protein bL17 n=3 Tax=Candidatus Magasanikiibacteriota TaxID=1752731 RepID=A0A1F6NG06_9BACT|nr:MAG: 50S ribosomal protein L17 [Candidatus Magasanikbacteria bacterium RIFOXYA2_FULL_40_20]OGH82792.1 MAG: 50S ribosomal protein L17 [Candidatus Magasanikbacteria bacterium RIFOXYB1_FULL_40_15]OGH86976.1 MAG: 50S ribosomal protein L17 [Candidatus Magasanikbacteria bacterium RIFOXYB2_FULL_40_13]OGH87752.1 MAG: 50S ribosomal protein L17 [Candidatus Magasanikbacteria bacterium RIFOXYA1_FULL_40_8]OGH90348.1 MAG: 50S ribosomal protein L17 [Candidatus Magasanikbacteria bacterium RIFOXYC2_FULL_40_1
MRHRKQKATLGREKAQRGALMRSLAQSLILEGSIRTTKAKARALRIFVEPLVTKAKKNDLVVRRNLLKVLYTKKAVSKLLTDIAPKYVERKGGYTRITKLGARANDSAEMAKIEFV